MIFHNRFVSQDELTEFLVGRRHLHHAVPQARADHLGHAGLRRRSREGGDLDAVPLRTRAARRRARASSCPGGTPTAIAREVIGLLGDDDRRPRDVRARGRARPRHALAGRRARATSRASSARAPSTRIAAARRSRRRRSPARPAGLPEINLEHVARDDRRHRHAPARRLQRPALRRRLLPRRQRARAAADDAPRGRRHR